MTQPWGTQGAVSMPYCTHNTGFRKTHFSSEFGSLSLFSLPPLRPRNGRHQLSSSRQEMEAFPVDPGNQFWMQWKVPGFPWTVSTTSSQHPDTDSTLGHVLKSAGGLFKHLCAHSQSFSLIDWGGLRICGSNKFAAMVLLFLRTHFENRCAITHGQSERVARRKRGSDAEVIFTWGQFTSRLSICPDILNAAALFPKLGFVIWL